MSPIEAPPRRRSPRASQPPSDFQSSKSPAWSPATTLEDWDGDRPTLRTALRHVDRSSAVLAAKAFLSATGIVLLVGFGAVWGLKSIAGLHDVRVPRKPSLDTSDLLF